MLLNAKRLEPAGRNISGGKRDFSACPAYRHQHIVAARVEQAVLRQRSRSHVADDGTSDERLAAPRLCLGRGLRLLRDGNAMTRADQASEVVFRSEEHTSELQPLMRISYAVFCLKTKNTN